MYHRNPEIINEEHSWSYSLLHNCIVYKSNTDDCTDVQIQTHTQKAIMRQRPTYRRTSIHACETTDVQLLTVARRRSV